MPTFMKGYCAWLYLLCLRRFAYRDAFAGIAADRKPLKPSVNVPLVAVQLMAWTCCPFWPMKRRQVVVIGPPRTGETRKCMQEDTKGGHNWIVW